MVDEKPRTPSGEHRRKALIVRDTLTDLEQIERIAAMHIKRDGEIETIKELREELNVVKLRLDHITTALRALLAEDAK